MQSETDKQMDPAALLAWQVAMGADEAVGDSPADRFALSEKAKPAARPAIQERPVAQAAPVAQTSGESAILAQKAAAACRSLDELRTAVEVFDGCSLKRTATNTVFADGNPDAPLMFIGEAPGADEDRIGKPFVGASGQLLDRMMAAVGWRRDQDYYISNILPWRPPGNRKPTPVETAMCLPFIVRHIALKKPKLLVFLGGTAAGALLDTTLGITRLRGRWMNYQLSAEETMPAMPTYHPAFLLRQPALKGDAWRDILEIKSRLERANQV